MLSALALFSFFFPLRNTVHDFEVCIVCGKRLKCIDKRRRQFSAGSTACKHVGQIVILLNMERVREKVVRSVGEFVESGFS